MSGEQDAVGVARELQDSYLDIAVVSGDGEDLFLKIGGEVVLTTESKARLLVGEIENELEDEPEEEVKVYQCPVCHTKCYGEQERDEHAKTEPGVQPSSFTWLGYKGDSI